jgi:hypothetical protein
MGIVSAAASTNGPGMGLLGAGGFAFSGVSDRVALHRNDRYITLLNRALRIELNCLHAFSGAEIGARDAVDCIVANHHSSVSDLSKLIVRRHGIPICHSSLAGGFGRAIVQISAHMPEWLHNQAQRSAILAAERRLARVYGLAIDAAPRIDVEGVEELLERAIENMNVFQLP